MLGFGLSIVLSHLIIISFIFIDRYVEILFQLYFIVLFVNNKALSHY